MVNDESAGLDLVFSALADPTRRRIVARLAEGEATVGDLAAPIDMSLPAVSKHLKVLERAGLIDRERDGRIHRCRLNADPMRDVADWVQQYGRFWSAQFDSLAKYVENPEDKEGG